MLCPGLNVYTVLYVNIMNRYKENTKKKNNTKTKDKNKIKRKMIFLKKKQL